jgi:hypothetical protein
VLLSYTLLRRLEIIIGRRIFSYFISGRCSTHAQENKSKLAEGSYVSHGILKGIAFNTRISENKSQHANISRKSARLKFARRMFVNVYQRAHN